MRSLGWGVFLPKVINSDLHTHGVPLIAHEFDDELEIPARELEALNRHNFYEDRWDKEIVRIANQYFSVVVTAFYIVPLREALRRFKGTIVARPFGREQPRTYLELITHLDPTLPRAIDVIGGRFVFGQAYENLAEIEPDWLAKRASTIGVGLPEAMRSKRDTWTGSGHNAVFVCPLAASSPYYAEIYRRIKTHFGDLPHVIFGRQPTAVEDDAVLPYLSDADLMALYAGTPVFAYPHREPRHLHYSPIEAMLVGAPVLFLRGSLLDTIAGRGDLPGRCADEAEMRAKVARLLGGDRAFAEAVRSNQGHILDAFSDDRLRPQWASVLRRATPIRHFISRLKTKHRKFEEDL